MKIFSQEKRFKKDLNNLFRYPLQEDEENTEPIKRKGTIGNITRIASYYDFNNKHKLQFSSPFLKLIKNFDFTLKIYLFDVINSFQYKDYRLLSDGFSWYNTRLLGLKDDTASKLLLKHKFLIYPEILPSDVLSKQELQQICISENVTVKKSYTRAKIIECLYAELDIDTMHKYVKKYGIVCINEYFNQDISFLTERLYENRQFAKQVFISFLKI